MSHEDSGHKRPARLRHWVALAGAAMGVGLIAFGVYGLREKGVLKQSASVPLTDQTVTTSTTTPDETPPHCQGYRVAPDTPRKILIPSLGVDGCIQKVALDQHSAVAVPSNIHLAGWFVKSVKPGDRGVSLIDGHVSGRSSSGIFKDLKRLKANDRIGVAFGSGTIRWFTVVSVNTYTVAEAANHLLQPTPQTPEQLNLITCDGRYNKTTGQYDQRVIAVSKRVE